MAALDERRRRKESGEAPDASAVFTPDGFLRWYQDFNRLPGRHRKTTVTYIGYHIRLLLRGLGVADIREITPQMLNQWRDERLRSAASKSPAAALKAATSVASITRNVRAALAQAAKPVAEGGAGVIPSNPFGAWKPFSKAERKRMVSERERFLPPPKLTVLELNRILAVADAYPQRTDGKPEEPIKIAASLCVWLLVTTGMRWTEAQFVRWENLDWGNRRLRLQPSEHFTTKSGKSRVVPLPQMTAEKLLRHRQADGYILPSDDAKGQGVGNRFDRVAVRPHVRRILDAAQLPRRMTPHGLRHAYVTICCESGIPQSVVQAVVGHSSSIVTAIYDHSEPDARVFDVLPFSKVG